MRVNEPVNINGISDNLVSFGKHKYFNLYKHNDNDVISPQNVISMLWPIFQLKLENSISFDHLALEHNFNPFPMNASSVIYVHWFHFGINFSNSFLIQQYNIRH